jgi:hypothetical protein
MKNIKMILTAAAVLAVVGGALSFKTRSSHQLYLKSGTQCTVLTDGRQPGGSGTSIDYNTLLDGPGTCVENGPVLVVTD